MHHHVQSSLHKLYKGHKRQRQTNTLIQSLKLNTSLIKASLKKHNLKTTQISQKRVKQ